MLSYRLTRITINMLLTQHKLPDWHCAKSVVSSLSCSKTMCQFIQWVRTASMSVSSISDFWNGRHPRSFRQAYDSGTQICPQWTTKFAQKFSSVFASKIITWSLTDIMEWLAGIFEQRIISNATDEWCKILLEQRSICRGLGGLTPYWLKMTPTLVTEFFCLGGLLQPLSPDPARPT